MIISAVIAHTSGKVQTERVASPDWWLVSASRYVAMDPRWTSPQSRENRNSHHREESE